ncbi:MAG: indolepyruvate ferredoxin oxidoreductase subunit alpha [Candidatus Heimdallarchaeota archaeon]
MTHVIAEPCIDEKAADCLEVCPVDCIEEGADQYYIDPEECIDCEACVEACPVEAIFHEDELPEKWHSFTEKNANFFANK